MQCVQSLKSHLLHQNRHCSRAGAYSWPVTPAPLLWEEFSHNCNYCGKTTHSTPDSKITSVGKCPTCSSSCFEFQHQVRIIIGPRGKFDLLSPLCIHWHIKLHQETTTPAVCSQSVVVFEARLQFFLSFYVLVVQVSFRSPHLQPSRVEHKAVNCDIIFYISSAHS